jgi:hypothetical protein
MKTLEQIKTDILASNPSRKYIINNEEFEQTELEFQEAVENRAKMEYEQALAIEALRQERLLKIGAYKKLGLTNEEIIALLGLTEEEAKLLLGGN